MSVPVWGPISPGDDTAPRCAGRCWIWLRSAEDEWEVSWSYADEPPAEAPADSAWTRYVSTEDDTLELTFEKRWEPSSDLKALLGLPL